ncbi:MAG: cytochrome c, partial [Opitutaceae bacterium]
MRIPRLLLGTLTLGVFLPILHAQPAVPEAAVPPPGPPVAQTSARPAPRLHTEFCVSCHGVNWEGGRAPSMLDDVWTHGGSDEELTKSIRDGWLLNAMPPFGSVLSNSEIRALIVQIRYARDKAKREPPQPARELDGMIIKSEL